MLPARSSVRVPRSTRLRAARVFGATEQQVVRRVEQKRWIQRPRPLTRRRPSYVRKAGALRASGTQHTQVQETAVGRNTQLAKTLAEADSSDLVADVRIPSDPHGVLPPDHPALSLLGNSSLVIQRQMEWMNFALGFEQANRYIIMDGQGQTLGYIAEQDHGLGRALMRQWTTIHRSFTTYIFDKDEREILRIHRPFAFINSRIRIYDPIPEGGYAETQSSTALQGTSAQSATSSGTGAQTSPLKLEEMRIIGEAQQQWAPLRRKYNLFSYRPIEPARNDGTTRIESGQQQEPSPEGQGMQLAPTQGQMSEQVIEAGMAQFAHVNEPFLSWDFTLKDEEQSTIGSVNRNFGGFAKEIFTDTGVYALRMDSAAQSSTLETADGKAVGHYEREATAMTLDQRAVMLATAVSIDFDYFSRHSHAGGGGFMPMMIPMGGGAAEGGAVGGAVGAAEGAAGAAGRGLGTGAGAAGEGAIAGAGTMAGYEAMQRGVYGPRGGDDASPTNNEPSPGDGGASQSPRQSGDETWGETQNPWGSSSQGVDPPSGGGGGGGGGGDGGGSSDWFSDFF